MEWGFNSPLAHDETADPSGSAVFVFLAVRGQCAGYRTKRVGFVVTFRLAGAGISTLKVVVSSWGYEYPHMPGVRASDDQVWALSVRGAAMALLPVQYQPGQPH